MIEILSDVIDILKQRGIVQRERTPTELLIYGIFLTTLGLSLRKTKRALEPLKTIVSHVAIWKWVHKLGNKLKDRIFGLEEMPAILVVDETKVKIGDREGYVWVAINPYNGKIVYMMLSFSRSSLVALLFFQRMIRVHGGRKPKIVITDDGNWYPYPLKRL